MNKQLRIWLFALLSTLLASTSLLAKGFITMTTSRASVPFIFLTIRANGSVSIYGVQGSALTDGSRKCYILTGQWITIRGDVTYLECSSNQLSSLGVSGCSALTTLDCSGNELTNLNVSKNTALTELDCGFNKLSSLDVSKNTALTTLDCKWNSLTNLNVSKNTALTKLDCGTNKLTSLDVSKNTALTTLDCKWNSLTNLNVSKNTALTKLDCSWNKLTSLDVSGGSALTKLDCSDNLLKQLNVEGCTNLSSLSCFNNEIKGTEMTNLVNSLPDRQGAEEGFFNVFKESRYEDGNGCLATHVATAKAKNWRTRIYRDDKSYDYAGLDKPTFAVTYSSSNGGSISITGADDLQNVPYDTELTVVTNVADGYKLTKLTANGQDILQTKRFKVTANTAVKATFADNTGVETTVTQRMQLYPNPATDHLVVEGVAPASEVTLHSMTGERLYAGRADDRGVLQIDLTPYADGVYLVCVAGETYRVVVRR